MILLICRAELNSVRSDQRLQSLRRIGRRFLQSLLPSPDPNLPIGGTGSVMVSLPTPSLLARRVNPTITLKSALLSVESINNSLVIRR